MKIADTIDYASSFNDPSWSNERSLADSIINFIKLKGLKFRLDHLTRGRGNCFMVATLQQMNRGEVAEVAKPEHVEMARSINHHLLRVKVRDKTQHSNHWKILELKERYNMDKVAREAEGEVVRTWDEYWDNMLIEGKWADYWFIQATAWLLDMDIQIVDTACRIGRGHYTIHGGLDEEDGYGGR